MNAKPRKRKIILDIKVGRSDTYAVLPETVQHINTIFSSVCTSPDEK